MNKCNPSPDFDFPTPPPDPNSPERQMAARYAKKAKVCNVAAIGGFVLLFIAALHAENGASWAIAPFLILLGIMLLRLYYKNKELKLRCTKRTTAICIDTVRRHSGKSVRRHPIVEYEVEGVTTTAELSVTCQKNAVGNLYSIYYDPLDPGTVRVE